jgi:tRNA (mo5U34)-methyltransferase
MGLSPEEIRARIAAVGGWWHSIELAPGIVTPGGKSADVLRDELAALRLDDLALAGKSVIDIGAWDGFYSFEAERRGAARVLALDHFVWCLDFAEAGRQREARTAAGLAPPDYDDIPSAWRPDLLPGKRGFDTAREILGSRVESHVGDLMEIDPAELGTFDVALYLGVLYHVKNPLEALRRLARITREVAVIETQAVVLDGFESFALCEFYETDECNGDPTNWWAPNEKALVGMCRAAGFREAKLVVAKPKEKLPRQRKIQHRLTGEPLRQARPPVPYRAIVHARK